MKKFEEYLAEAKGSTFAWKTGSSKWEDGIHLPFASAKDLVKAVNSERADVSSIVALVKKHYQAPNAREGDMIEVIDMSAKVASSTGETAEVEVKFNYFRDRTQIRTIKLLIQED